VVEMDKTFASESREVPDSIPG